MSSSDGSSKTSTSAPCSDAQGNPCGGTCVFVAKQIGNSLYWDVPSYPNANFGCAWGDGTPGASGVDPCRCTLPSRPPDFVGDTETTDCTCCQGRQYVWTNSWSTPFNTWLAYPVVADPCSSPECNDQNVQPTGLPTQAGGLDQSKVVSC